MSERSSEVALARVLGPDLIELLLHLVREEVADALRERESEQRWLTPEAASKRYGISASALRKRAARGTIRSSRIGRRLLIDVRSLAPRAGARPPMTTQPGDDLITCSHRC